MRDDELRRILTDANPWWRAAAAGTDPTAWARSHRLLRDRTTHDLGYESMGPELRVCHERREGSDHVVETS